MAVPLDALEQINTVVCQHPSSPVRRGKRSRAGTRVGLWNTKFREALEPSGAERSMEFNEEMIDFWIDGR
jgi:hypothetical protein